MLTVSFVVRVRKARRLFGFTACLLVLAALIAVAGEASAGTFSGARSGQVSQSMPAASDEAPAALQDVLCADRDTERPCGRGSTVPGTARCSTVQCIGGGLPATAIAIPAPEAIGDEHVRAAEDSSRGIATIPDLPPPRASA